MPITQAPKTARASAPATPAAPPRATTISLQQESELIVAILRAALTMLAAFTNFLLPQELGDHHTQLLSGIFQLSIVFAVAYTGLVFLLHWLRWRPRGLRHVMAILDILLVTVWVYATWQTGLHGNGSILFPFYFVLIITNALWFGVAGALGSAILILCLYLGLIYLGSNYNVTDIVEALYRNGIYLFLVAIVTGYLVDTHKREREMWTRSQVLLAQYQERFRAAQEVYDLLLPTATPTLTGIEVGARWRPVLQEGGGDFYDVIPLEDGRVVLTIADVSGKHMRGAIKLPIFKSAFVACAQVWDDPGAILSQVNRIVYPLLQPDMFISACVMVLDPARARFAYANGGQDPPLLIRARGNEIVPLDAGGLVLGVDAHAAYPTGAQTLEPGDTLCLYTDGITEARSALGVEFGDDSLIARARAGVGIDLSAEAIADNIFDAVNTYIQGAARRDDQTLVVVRYRGT